MMRLFEKPPYPNSSTVVLKRLLNMAQKLLIFALILCIDGCDSITESPDNQLDEAILSETPAPIGTAIEGQYIVVLKKGALPLGKSVSAVSSMATTILRESNIEDAVVDNIYNHALTGFVLKATEDGINRLKDHAQVDYVEQDRIIGLARPSIICRGLGHVEGQLVHYGILKTGSVDGTGKTAWVIDTGIDLDHPDLNVDNLQSISFVTRGKYTADDINGHGTHVAGIIGAIDNEIGTLGVAHDATVVSVRVLANNGSGELSWLLSGIDYVAANAEPGDVVNISLGTPESQILDDAVVATAEMGLKFAIAAGNDGIDASLVSPARVEHPNVFTVSAVGPDDSMPSWSNYGAVVDFAAQGVCIPSSKKGGRLKILSGTSQAAPHVAGILLMIPEGGTVGDIIEIIGYAISDPDGIPDPIPHLLADEL